MLRDRCRGGVAARPAGTPARGAWFWLCLLGIPNAVFFAALGVARAGYEADYLYALLRNQHRAAWLKDRLRVAQRPLQVLGAGYCLPLGGRPIGEVLGGMAPQVEARVPRSGTGRVVHSRFADDDPLFSEAVEERAQSDDEMIEAIYAERAGAGAPIDESIGPVHSLVLPVVRVVEGALTPIVESLLALSQYGPKYAPAVRVLSAPGTAGTRAEQVRQALRRAGLPELECVAVPAEDGLMVADAWLDAAERRPLLVIAAEWHDAPPPGSTEGAVAVLLSPGVFQLPESVRVAGVLHRPAADDLEGLDAVLANGVLWGKADAAAVDVAWISGLDGSRETVLLAALRSAGLAGVAKQETQRRPDRLIGHAGAAGGWLSIAAAIEATSGTQLILHAPSSASIAQVAILRVNDRTNNEKLDDERSQ